MYIIYYIALYNIHYICIYMFIYNYIFVCMYIYIYLLSVCFALSFENYIHFTAKQGPSHI